MYILLVKKLLIITHNIFIKIAITPMFIDLIHIYTFKGTFSKYFILNKINSKTTDIG